MTTLFDARRLLSLPENWDSYGAKEITEAAIQAAEAAIIVPLSNGGVQIEWHIGGADIEIAIGADGRIEDCFCSWGNRI